MISSITVEVIKQFGIYKCLAQGLVHWIRNANNKIFFFFNFGSIGARTQGLMLATQELYHLSYITSPFCVRNIFKIGSLKLSAQQALNLDPPDLCLSS
jgi:hypothetical protein